MEPEQRGEAEEHAQRIGRRRPLRRIVRVQELLEPGPGFGNLTMDAAAAIEMGEPGRSGSVAPSLFRRIAGDASARRCASRGRPGPARTTVRSRPPDRGRDREEQLVVVAPGEGGRDRVVSLGVEPAPGGAGDGQRLGIDHGARCRWRAPSG